MCHKLWILNVYLLCAKYSIHYFSLSGERANVAPDTLMVKSPNR